MAPVPVTPVPEEIKQLFLPPGTPSYPKVDAISSAGRSPRDREADPRVIRDRMLGDYGWKLLAQIIDKEYNDQIKEWTVAFKEVTAAYATAVDMRIKTFAEAHEERESDAARDAFIFSLLTSGAMSLLGAWVQYSLIPSIKITRSELTNPSAADYLRGVYPNKAKFSPLQAAMFGGITQEVGNKFIALASPERKSAAAYPMDQPSVAANLDADFGKLVNDSAKVVTDELRDAQAWMRESTEFGEAWLAYTRGNADTARMEIRLHFDKLRQEWASKWEFFGKTPRPIVRKLLADQYERGLWTDYILKIFAQAMKTMGSIKFSPDPGKPGRMTLDKAFPKLDDMSEDKKLDLLEFEEDDVGSSIYHEKWVEAAIVNRLKELNVVFAEMDPGKLDQANRMIEGSPRPDVDIKGAVNRGHDIKEIYGWATRFLKSAPGETARNFYPPAKPRTLTPLQSYQ